MTIYLFFYVIFFNNPYLCWSKNISKKRYKIVKHRINQTFEALFYRKFFECETKLKTHIQLNRFFLLNIERNGWLPNYWEHLNYFSRCQMK